MSTVFCVQQLAKGVFFFKSKAYLNIGSIVHDTVDTVALCQYEILKN